MFFISLVIIVSGALISYLSYRVDDFKGKKIKLENEYTTLLKDNSRLKLDITSKAKDLRSISSKIEDIEQMLDLKHNDNSSPNERVNLAKLSTYKKYFILNNIPNGYPVENKGITSKYGWRIHPITKEREFHRGIDLRAKLNTPVIAPADGVIEYAANHKKSGYGKLMIIRHNYGFTTMYAHLNKFKIRAGRSVAKGDTIAFTGNSGRSNGPHLHYEIRNINRNLDPKNFLVWNYKNFDELFNTEKKVYWNSLLNLVDKQISGVKNTESNIQTKFKIQNIFFNNDSLNLFPKIGASNLKE